MSTWDALTGEPQEEDRPKRRSTNGWQKARASKPASRRTETPSRAQRNVRPEGVSERVWGLAEQWLEMGEAHFGKRPPVNKQEFSKRLAAKIKGDLYLQGWLRRKPKFWAQFDGAWEDGYAFVNDVLAKALELFWKYLTEEQTNTSALQFAFLEDEWSEWIYQAGHAVQIAWLKENAEWVKIPLPKGVFDRDLKPRPEDPCTDPMFEGMTWGEVWAQHEHDIESLEPLSDEEYEAGERAQEERLQASHERIARLRGVMLSNRGTTTTKENHHE